MSDASLTDEVQEMETKGSGKESQKFLAEFIEIYRAYPCLWKYNSREYRNRIVEECAYKELVDKMREVDPRADKGSVIRKINVLRTAFRREYKKVKKYGAHAKLGHCVKVGKKRKYESTLWYYDLMKFVVEGQEYPDADIDIDEMNDWMHDSSASLEEDGKIVDHSAESLMEFLEDSGQTEVKIEASSPTSSRAVSPVMNLATNNSGSGLQLEINDVYSEKSNQPTLPTLRRDEPLMSLQEPPPLAPISRPRRLPVPPQLPVQPQPAQQATVQQSPQVAAQQPQVAQQAQQSPQQQPPPPPPSLPQQQQQPQQVQPHSLQQIQQHVQLHQIEVEHADFDRFGTYVAAKLKRSTRKQGIIAEKVIAEVLMRANLGTLEETTRLTDLKM